MQKNIVIVESPAKAKTIGKFLGKDYKVVSSYGHIRDLKKKGLGIDLKNNFNPLYEVPQDKAKLVDELKKDVSKSEVVWLASDEDREGEAIAWHLYDTLELTKEKTKRIVFHEITKTAILRAIDTPRSIDVNLVNAQQARRVLDRLVGFELSPVLWRKIKPDLSAGRVQSVAVRLIVEKEKEVDNFSAKSNFRIIGSFIKEDGEEFVADLSKRAATKEEASDILSECKKEEKYIVENVEQRPVKRSPGAPFTTSTLQQDAARKLGYTVTQTMMLAQRLYESGKITYMRTDSVNLSQLALDAANETIKEKYGEKYAKRRNYHTHSKGAQEAHEAIRPTDLSLDEISGTNQEKSLYRLIWRRTIASQMSDAIFEKTTATISFSNKENLSFVASGDVLVFDGFMAVSREKNDDKKSQSVLPPLKVGDSLTYDNITATERFTQRPVRYTEAGLVKKMEELGIGRPSTYAPTISTIQQRGYVEKGEIKGVERSYEQIILTNNEISSNTLSEVTGAEKGKMIPTNVGIVVNNYLLEVFPQIMDYNFTASVERDFDKIADGAKTWQETIHEFYGDFHPLIDTALTQHLEHKVGERILGDDPKTGAPVSVKIGRYGAVAQIGSASDEKKPRFAALRKGQNIETITLEEVLELFKLPRNLGLFEDEVVTVGVGRFGCYILHNKKYVSLPKSYDPLEVSLTDAIDLIMTHRKAEKERILKAFDEEPNLQVLNGRYGPYIAYNKKNYKLPKSVEDPKKLTLEECQKIIAETPDKPARGRKRKVTKKK